MSKNKKVSVKLRLVSSNERVLQPDNKYDFLNLPKKEKVSVVEDMSSFLAIKKLQDVKSKEFAEGVFL